MTGASSRRSSFLALLVSDLVDSTGLVERLGDRRASDLLRRHDRIARNLLATYDGREIDKTDGFLLVFDHPAQAACYALAYHDALRELGAAEGVELAARVGIHFGEVFLWENTPGDVRKGAKPLEVEGLAKPVAARLMSGARGGQTLLTTTAYELARRAARQEPELGSDRVEWEGHGRYRLQGVETPVEVFEVGRRGMAPFVRPRDSAKVHRDSGARRRRAYRWSVGALGTAGALVLGLGLFQLLGPSKDALALAQHDWIVVGNLRNLTGDPLLDESLGLAFRVGLEQSRFARVVPEHRMHQVLARMRLDPESRIDRAIGLEICQREGAKALVTGSVSEIGGNYALSAEIVDPRTGDPVTVRTATAGGREQIVRAVGELTRDLRQELGESLAAIRESGPALEAVTTSDLEALKAYSVALRRVAEGDTLTAVDLLERAVALDPEFAAAHAKLGTVYYSVVGNPVKAAHHWNQALSYTQRLSEREKIYVTGSRAWLGEPSEMLRAWKVMVSLYPEAAAGHNNLGIVYWWHLVRFREAVEAFGRAVERDDPWTLLGYHNLGSSLLGLGRVDEATEAFETAWEMERNPVRGGLSDAYVVARRYRDADRFLVTMEASTTARTRFEATLRRIELDTDRGKVEAALALAEDALEQSDAFPTEGAARLRVLVARAALLEAQGRTEELQRLLTEAADEILPDLDAEDALLDRPVAKLALLGKLAVRNGSPREGLRLAAAVEPVAAEHDVPVWTAYRKTLHAEIELADGRATEAVRLAQEALEAADLFQAHETLSRAYEAAGDLRAARTEAGWLVAHRGQAFGEWLDEFFGRPVHILDWARARYRLATLAEAAGDHAAAAEHLRAFLAHWSEADGDLPLRTAAQELLRTLAPASEPRAVVSGGR